MNSKDKVQAIIKALESGKTIFVNTYTRSTKITPTTFKKWNAAGHTLFKADDKSMYMASGNKFVCIDYCQITVA